jgi:N-acetylglucosaminyldiphosphoundecaprenol N-acetyl-beta-D-mannosaminyltransferase
MALAMAECPDQNSSWLQHMNADPQRVYLGPVACCTHTIPQLLAELETLLRDKSLRPRTILTVNAHIYNRAVDDPRLRGCLNEARIVTADGMAIVWAARLLGVRIPDRCNMTEAFRAFLLARPMPPSRAILVGCGQEEAEAAAAEIRRLSTHCRVVKAFSGYFAESQYAEILPEYKDADLILLGMGTPRTEMTAQLAAEICPEAIVWGIGGGTVRIFAGTMREAPVLWRRLGLQWLYRLLREPRQLWHRYLIGNPLFGLRILKIAWRRERPAKCPK